MSVLKVNADLYVKDVPGQLVGTLDPISAVEGNIVGVVHNREKMMDDRIGVNITFEVGSQEQLEKLKNIWKSKDVLISRIGSVVESFPMEYMLIGNVNASYVENLLAEAQEKIGFDSVDVRYSSKAGTNKHTVMISAKVRSKKDIKKLDKFISSVCKKSSILYIRGVEE